MQRAAIAWGLLPVILAVLAGIKILSTLNGEPSAIDNDISLVVAGIVVVLIAILIISRQPGNPIGWILFVGASCMFAAEFTYQWAVNSLLTNPAGLPFGLAAGFFSLWLWNPAVFCLFILLPLLFPTGRPISPLWGKVVAFSWALCGFVIILYGFYPGPMDGLEPVINPLAINLPIELFEFMEGVSTYGLIGITGLALLSVFVRHKISTGDERAQMKWFLFAAAVLFLNVTRGIISESVSFLPSLPESVENILFALNIALIAAAIGIAILKYRLYEIDVIIRKTLVYGSLTSVLALVYFGSVTVMQSLIRSFTSQDSPVSIVLSTLIIAALFSPLRSWIQRAIDRRFYRSKYDTEKIISSFGAGLREQIDFEQTADQLVGLIEDTMKPSHLSLWLISSSKRKTG